METVYYTLADGDKVVIRGADKCPDGYIADPIKRKVYHPIVVPCQYMTTVEKPSTCSRCKKTRTVRWCSLYEKERDDGICNTCQRNSAEQTPVGDAENGN